LYCEQLYKNIDSTTDSIIENIFKSPDLNANEKLSYFNDIVSIEEALTQKLPNLNEETCEYICTTFFNDLQPTHNNDYLQPLKQILKTIK
jgi:hypothetical protein